MTKLQGKLQHSHDMAQHRKNLEDLKKTTLMERVTVEILLGYTLIVIVNLIVGSVLS